MSWHKRISSEAFATEKNGSIPLHRLTNRQPSGLLRLRWIPCLAAIAGTFLISAVCFDFYGGLQNLFTGVFADSTVVQTPPSSARFDGWEKLDRLFVFGETYSATGFNVNGTQPSVGNPFGNPTLDYAPGMPSLGPTGPVWVHYITQMYNRSMIRTYDLAVGGGTINRNLVNPVFPTAKTFYDQIQHSFIPFYGQQASDAGWSPSKTLFAISFGVMDMIIPFHEEKRPEVDKLLSSYETELNKLYDLGARNFLLLNIPPVDRPYRSDKAGVRALHTDVIAFNRQLSELRQHFVKDHRDANAFLFDTNSLFEAIIAEPSTVLQTNRITYTKGPCPRYDLGIGFEGVPDLDRLDPKYIITDDMPRSEFFLRIQHGVHDFDGTI
ncbi:MAG: hypothetical protein Q9159_003588 [Coniocarpon cinnabarinum]